MMTAFSFLANYPFKRSSAGPTDTSKSKNVPQKTQRPLDTVYRYQPQKSIITVTKHRNWGNLGFANSLTQVEAYCERRFYTKNKQLIISFRFLSTLSITLPSTATSIYCYHSTSHPSKWHISSHTAIRDRTRGCRMLRLSADKRMGERVWHLNKSHAVLSFRLVLHSRQSDSISMLNSE